MVCSPSSRQRSNLYFKRKISVYIPHGSDTDHYAAGRLLWTSMGAEYPVRVGDGGNCDKRCNLESLDQLCPAGEALAHIVSLPL